MQRVMLGMSGGVDSSVAALLLRDAGYEVCGVTLQLLDDGSAAAADDARCVCGKLGIAHKVLDCRDAFKRCVMQPFIASYREAHTPNPCIECNRTIKFPLLFDAAQRHGYDSIATGHYARIVPAAGGGAARTRLLRARDSHKDQSYVLYSLSQELLSHTLLPLGELGKDEVRQLALDHGLAVASKPDSQDICFIAQGDYAAFLECSDGFESLPGDIVDEAGKVLGRHRGLHRYTVGQRKGIGIAPRSIDAAPYYVLALDAENNRLIVGDKSRLAISSIMVGAVNWVSIEEPSEPLRALVKTRYAQTPIAARIEYAVCGLQEDVRVSMAVYAGSDTLPSADGIQGSPPPTCTVTLDKPLDGVAPGQACVFYDETGTTVLGGGAIVTAHARLA